MIATRLLFMEWVLVVAHQNGDSANALQLRNVAMANIFLFFFIFAVHIGATR